MNEKQLVIKLIRQANFKINKTLSEMKNEAMKAQRGVFLSEATILEQAGYTEKEAQFKEIKTKINRSKDLKTLITVIWNELPFDDAFDESMPAVEFTLIILGWLTEDSW